MFRGFSHLAAATSTPCIGIYGPTNPEIAKIHGVNQAFVASTMPCAPCHKRLYRLERDSYMRCMQIIEPATFWNKCCALLDKTSR